MTTMPDSPIDYVGVVGQVDALMDGCRWALAALGDVRARAVSELVAREGAIGAAEALGVSRQAVYKAQGRKATP
jgi:hypothetical protein